jgi:hypothetical protein
MMSSGDDTHHHRGDITHESNNSSDEDAFVEYYASEAVRPVRVLIERNM